MRIPWYMSYVLSLCAKSSTLNSSLTNALPDPIKSSFESSRPIRITPMKTKIQGK